MTNTTASRGSRPDLIICDKCGGEFGVWDYRKKGNRRMPVCKACEAEKKAASMRKKQKESAENHLLTLEANKRVSQSWEEKATARIHD